MDGSCDNANDKSYDDKLANIEKRLYELEKDVYMIYGALGLFQKEAEKKYQEVEI